MAASRRKSPSKKKTGKKAKDGEIAVSLSIELDHLEDAPSYYINYIEVSHSQHDFSLHLVQIPSKLSSNVLQEAKDSGKMVLEPMLNVTIASTLVPSLISALQLQQAKFETLFGPIESEAKK